MELISVSTIITTIVLTALTELGLLFGTPLYNCFKPTLEAIRDPQSLDEDGNELNQLLIKFNTMSDKEVDEKWRDDAKKTIDQIVQLQQRERGSSNHNDDHQSGCFCCGDACSQFYLRRNVKKLIARGKKITRPHLGKERIDRIPNVPAIREGTTAGRKLEEVREVVNDDNGWCIGVWGPGGVGKTTLVKALYNELAETKSPFTLVRLVELARDAKDDDIQKAIAKSLDLEVGEGIQGKICNTLQREKFLLILDNVWSDSIQLSSIGIPEGEKGSKIILTTRFHSVCARFRAKKIKVECLTEAEAWQLFAEQAGGVVDDVNIKSIAKKVCKECGRLPFALVVVGAAMTGEKRWNRWSTTLRNLQRSTDIHNDVNVKLFDRLKWSYDSLTPTLRSCFLYCSLYPEDCSIQRNELIQCWIAEKFIDELYPHEDAYSEGFNMIQKLMESCLLEHGDDYTSNHIKDDDIEDEGFHIKYDDIEDEGFQTVKMHDVVRNAARWIAKSEGKSVVFSGVCRTPGEDIQKYGWISFLDSEEIAGQKNKDSEVIDPPKKVTVVPKATTLLLHGKSSSEVKVPTEFVNGFQEVRVLNIQAVQSFQASLLQLAELRALFLRNCSGIEQVPSAGKLQTLDLSYSMSLKKLLEGMEKLTNLRALNLSHTNFSFAIDADVIRKLNFLEVLDMSHSRYKWPTRKSCTKATVEITEEKEKATLEDLSALRKLREVYLQLADASGTYKECSWMENLQSFHFSYRRCATRFRREKKIYVATDKGTEVGTFILHAEKLSLRRIGWVNSIFARFSSSDQSNSKLKALSIGESKFLTKSTTNAPEHSVLSNLVKLYLYRNEECTSFSEIASALGNIFPSLRSLEFDGSVEVVFSSADRHLRLPELENVRIKCCVGKEAFKCGPTEIETISPKIRILEIHNSQELESISWDKDKQWQSLRILEVKNCPKLMDLPHMPFIEEIRGSHAWWNKVREEIKSSMDRRFKPI